MKKVACWNLHKRVVFREDGSRECHHFIRNRDNTWKHIIINSNDKFDLADFIERFKWLEYRTYDSIDEALILEFL